ncbi:MAG: type II secretion system protein [Patescibacteria group bacterium]|nr:type II secretion system protein [Patescibacteria group bacterium]
MKHNYNKLHNKNGFTLVETLVAVGIFSIVVSVAVGAFIGSSSSQKKIIELSDTQREASYLIETVSRELRMATAINPDQENNNTHKIEFTNYESILVEYCRADQSGNCDNSGDYFARDGEIINSSKIKITNLIFYVTDNFDGLAPVEDKKQPVITVSMKVQSTGKYGTEFVLQNSIALRLYN